jgi:hypothetical protein
MRNFGRKKERKFNEKFVIFFGKFFNGNRGNSKENFLKKTPSKYNVPINQTLHNSLQSPKPNKTRKKI